MTKLSSDHFPADDRTLLLLGLLTEQDRHGYEINDFIERNLDAVIRLKKATAYQLLARLEGHGLIESRAEALGQRPTRRVFHLTEAGRSHFQRLLAEHLPRSEALIPEGNVPVMFSEHLPPAEVLAALRERLAGAEEQLAAAQAAAERSPCTSSVGLALERILWLTRADRDWLRAAVARLERELGAGDGTSTG
ncbi:transcriptional regulator, PadR-like family [Deinococcus proteolyticus MRP]|uniref:Transcriptional regulator, PadR-like family n=1 Tax=Deinococcus proteolyticus (strain ATCC 35074 / DSM 20540 / JCM 6276 / NBRC 101906 / NCIMB 13154 / VKM Ac-1939 / CCM 2703 / MRP) TaxID=693977 RepID=F0RN89_DEIPM|nr:PadR family transcriptional regulator [Deinococcus proteolyticus]ADY26231.1 transcriptional regulator, PadR-like family [Deinococcus proteolyticus MRP]